MLRKIIASLIFVIFVVASIPFFFGLAFGKTFFSSSFYSGTLLDTAYSPFIDVATRSVYELDPAFQKYFTEDEIREKVQTHFPDDVLKQAIENSVRSFSSASISQDTKRSTNFQLDLTPVVNASSGFVRDMIRLVFDKIPACKPGETPVLKNQKDIFESCIPPQLLTPANKQKVIANFEQMYQKMLFKEYSRSGGGYSYQVPVPGSRASYLQLAGFLDSGLLYLAAFLVAFTIFLLLTWVRSWDIGLRWVGTMWITSAVLGGIFAFFLLFSHVFIPSEVFGVPPGSESYTQLMSFVQIIFAAFAKIYAFILCIPLLVGIFLYLAGRRL